MAADKVTPSISLRSRIVVQPIGDGSPGHCSFSNMVKQLLKYGSASRRVVKN